MIKPLPNWVLIEPLEEEQTISGIKLPDSSQDYPVKGKIIKTSNYMENENYNLVLWDMIEENKVVYFKKFAGQEIKQEGKILKLVEFKDLIAIEE